VATTDQHRAQFEHNAAVATKLADSGDHDWAVTALFYAALHLCQVYLLRNALSAESHRQRERQILASSELRPILDQYKALRTHSEHARYECRPFSPDEFAAIHRGSFATVIEHLHSVLGVP
jgi:hypothetical protein